MSRTSMISSILVNYNNACYVLHFRSFNPHAGLLEQQFPTRNPQYEMETDEGWHENYNK